MLFRLFFFFCDTVRGMNARGMGPTSGHNHALEDDAGLGKLVTHAPVVEDFSHIR
jgi:hypothetical protein